MQQAWAILRCVVSMIYLNMIKLAVFNEILHTRLLYSLKVNFGTKKFFWPSCDLLLNFIVLVKDLGLSLKEKNSNMLFLTNFGSLNPNLNWKKFFDPGLVRKWALKWQKLDFEKKKFIKLIKNLVQISTFGKFWLNVTL